MERLIYDERTGTFRWKGVYSDIQCKEDILSNLEDIDDLASQGSADNLLTNPLPRRTMLGLPILVASHILLPS